MSARQLHSKGQSDRLSLPYTTNKGKEKGKKSNQMEMEQQQHEQLQQQPTVQLSPL